MTQVALSGLVVAMAASALAASARADPDPGVSGQLAAGIVTAVVPGSPAWRDGIRPGQRVIDLADSGSPGGWRIVTVDDGVTRSSSGVAQADVLRLYIWWALPALAIAAIVGFLGYRRGRAAAPLIPLALAFAVQPLMAIGRADVAIAGGVATFVGGGLSVAAFGERRVVSWVAFVVGTALASVWVIAILFAPQAFDLIDGLRTPSAFAFATLGFIGVTDRERISAWLTDQHGIGFVDVAYLAGTIGLLATLAVLAQVPTALLIVGGVAGVAVYPLWRRRTLAFLDRAVTAPTRRHAIVRAVESERGRLAREIHDSPLQELTGVIRRLESVPGSEAETHRLRDVASHLREVATSLHPPVLQDLGLPAAIEDHAEQLAHAFPLAVEVSIDDLTGGARPPSEVELAAFRVVQEACANSLTHSKGTAIRIQGAVAVDSIDLTISDNGVGLDRASLRAARRSGHFGLDSMKERAEAVGGSSQVSSQSTGVTVAFRWAAPD